MSTNTQITQDQQNITDLQDEATTTVKQDLDSVTHGAKPGLCVIIQQDTFDQAEPKLEDLPGYGKDLKSLCITFWQFGFDIRTYVNLTAERLTQTMEELAKEKDANKNSIFKGYANLVVCILSYGGLETVYGIDGKAVNIKDLQSAFSTEKCPELNGKPKVFFIHKHDGPVADQPEEEPKNGDNNSLPFSDVIQLMCRGKVYPELGTEFVQYLCFHLRFVSLDIEKAKTALHRKEINELPKSYYINSFPSYLSNISSNKMVGLKTVPPTDRCTQIYCDGNKSTSSYQYLAKFITTIKILGIQLDLTDAVSQVSTSENQAAAEIGLQYWLFNNQL